MRYGSLGSLLLLAALVAVAAAPAAMASHPPTQHASQRISAASTLIETQLGSMPLSMSFECVDGMAGPYPCRDVDLAGFVALPLLGGATGNDIWGWTDPETGHEYAIMGTSTSTGFVDVTDPENPLLVGVLPTRGIPDFVLWRDVKVDGNYAFIVAEVTGGGLQVFDLTRLRGRTSPAVFAEDASYDEYSNAHNISINTETDYAYAVGTNTCEANDEAGGLHMVDISDPLNPTFAGCATVDSFADAGTDDEEPNNYVHDVECVIYDGPDTDHTGREICVASNEDVIVVYDVTDKADPQVISEVPYEGSEYTHQGSLTEDQRWFLFGDELDEQTNGHNTRTYILDLEDLDNPPAPLVHEHASQTIDHNMYVHGNRVYQSNYMEGLRILEFDDASLAAGRLNEVAFFDVLPGLDIAEFAGTWSNYRFPSGTTVVSAIENEVSGLFVLRPTLE